MLRGAPHSNLERDFPPYQVHRPEDVLHPNRGTCLSRNNKRVNITRRGRPDLLRTTVVRPHHHSRTKLGQYHRPPATFKDGMNLGPIRIEATRTSDINVGASGGVTLEAVNSVGPALRVRNTIITTYRRRHRPLLFGRLNGPRQRQGGRLLFLRTAGTCHPQVSPAVTKVGRRRRPLIEGAERHQQSHTSK